MRENDGRKSDHRTLEVLRLRAVEQVQAGAHPEDVARTLGLHRKTVYGWLAKFREGGRDALMARPVPGRPPKLSGARLHDIHRLTLRRILPLTIALAVVLVGCSARLDDRDGRDSTLPTTSPPPFSSTPTTSASSVDSMRSVCERLNRAAIQFTLSHATAIGKIEKGPALQAAVSAAYRDFATKLITIGIEAQGNLSSILDDWASVSVEVAEFIEGYDPKPGIVVEYGPAHPRWRAAQTAAENACGHPLPKI